MSLLGPIPTNTQSDTSALSVERSALSVSSVPSVPPGVPIFDHKDRITVLTPCYDFTLTEYYHNSLDACKQAQAYFRKADGSVHLMPIIAGRMSLPNDSHIDRARNVLTNLFVRAWEAGTGTRKCYWWDADIEMHPQQLMRLFLQSAHRGHPFVCGAYASKCLTPTFIVNVKPGAKPDPETGLIEALHAGTGSMLWDVVVPLSLQKHPEVKAYRCAPNTPWPWEKFYAYFSSGVYGAPDDNPNAKPKTQNSEPKTEREALPQWQSEDWKVCMLWQDQGGKVLVDTEVKLRHLGRMLYPPTFTELVGSVGALLEQHNPGLAEHMPRLRKAVLEYKEPLKQAA